MKESDWKTFRDMTPSLRERYLTKKNQIIRAALTASGRTETERFWDAFKVMKDEARILEACLDGHSRSKMFQFMWAMREVGMLTEDDLKLFSPEMQEHMKK